ncbi:exopolysaccharide biosynthesis polyprenyl glycosylphosphotransferase [Pedobacter sp. N23S346]|uniref:exopolysaccharide biosynthesis polyprenyl glycosylphosphotransferase n=1 Tax=Pedobacter sp. N23S346 TaxID=3402750 RepID=UPI003ACEA262
MNNFNLSDESIIEHYETELSGNLNGQFVLGDPLEAANREYLFQQQLKRVFDVLFSLTVLVAFSWVYVIIAILIRADSKGKVIFKQKRTGKDDQAFWCYKFRTMVVNDHAHTNHAQKNDARITGIGRFLRKSSLDELPQFFNVLNGTMSVVGPRPHMLKHTEEYRQTIDNFMVRHSIKPGITGWAQVKGFRGNTTGNEMMENRVKHDIWYLENWSNKLDLKIIILTARQVFKGHENAF